MALGINTNVASLSAQNQLNSSQRSNDQALERLSSGLRINSAKDDAAGLAISTRFSAQISGQNVAQRNANDGISYAQTAEGALGEITNALSRIRDLAVQSANDTNSASDREALNQETQALISEVNRIADSTQFNGQNVIDGSLEELQFQVGANAGQTISVEGVNTKGNNLGSDVFTTGADTIAQSDVEALVTAADTNAFTINGEEVDLEGVDSVASLRSAINAASGSTGVTAATKTDVDVVANLGAITPPGAGESGTLNLNGTEFAIGATQTVGDLVTAINQETGTTGITAAEVGTNELQLTSSNGETITAELTGTGATAFAELAEGDTDVFEAGLDLRTEIGGSINIASDTADVVSNVFGADGDLTGLESDTLDAVNISTREGATAAISTIDQALDQVNGVRAELGAVQARFDSAISNLASSTENLSAANSRILDADFAAETAALSKSQVLQQAGISVLAQANARPQQVLSLLQ